MRRNKINCQIIFRILRDQKNTSLLSQAVKMAPSAAGEFAFVSLVVWLWTKARSGSGSEGLGRCGRHHGAMQWVLLHCMGTSGGHGTLWGARGSPGGMGTPRARGMPTEAQCLVAGPLQGSCCCIEAGPGRGCSIWEPPSPCPPGTPVPNPLAGCGGTCPRHRAQPGAAPPTPAGRTMPSEYI